VEASVPEEPLAATPQQTLEWEARRRPSAVVAAVVAAVFTLVGSVGTQVLFTDAPVSGWATSLQRAAEGGALGAEPSLRTEFFEFYVDNGALILTYSALRFLGLLALGWALTYLAIATRARRPEFPRFAMYLPLVGGVLSAIAALLYDLAYRGAIEGFLDGPRTVDAADDVTTDSLLVMAQFIGLPGALGLSIGFVIVSLNAMRAGLLTRFMGVLGIIVGVLIIFPLGSPLPIVQCFWLVALAALFAGRWPSGPLAAWTSGEARPWPSSAEIRQARMREAEGRRGAGKAQAESEADPEPAAVPVGSGHPAAKKRKRKRRT
jgi:hypothetical protein